MYPLDVEVWWDWWEVTRDHPSGDDSCNCYPPPPPTAYNWTNYRAAPHQSPHSNFAQLNWRAAEEGREWWWSYCKLMLIFTMSSLSSLCRDCDTLIAGNNLLHWVSLSPRHLTLIEKPLLDCNCNYRLVWPIIYGNWRNISPDSIFVQTGPCPISPSLYTTQHYC